LNGEQDPGSNPGYSTISTSWKSRLVTSWRVCLWWGRVGIDWRTIRWVELPGCKRRTANKNYNCKWKFRISSL